MLVKYRYKKQLTLGKRAHCTCRGGAKTAAGVGGSTGSRAARSSNKEETEEQRNARLSNNYEYYTLVKRVAPEFPKRALRGGFKGYVVMNTGLIPRCSNQPL